MEFLLSSQLCISTYGSIPLRDGMAPLVAAMRLFALHVPRTLYSSGRLAANSDTLCSFRLPTMAEGMDVHSWEHRVA